ncbi:MAG: gliding motility-associated C-terminal domain-containing protein [Bacteroidota bacterium]
MIRSSLHIVIFILLASVTNAQNLYVPTGARVTISDGALLHASGDIDNDGIIAGINTGSLGTDQALQNNGTIGLATDSELTIGGTGINDGSVTSSGTVLLGGDWTNNNVSNFVDGTVEFIGMGPQLFTEKQMFLKGMTMNAMGPVTLNSPGINITGELDFQSGVLMPQVDKLLILESSAAASGGTETSYYDGTLISRGTGFRYFPVGNNGHFGPVEFDNIEGIGTEMGVNHIWTNPTDPVPGEDLLGVSPNGLWSAELISGSFDGSRLFMDFRDEDLANFAIENQITATYVSPVIAYADSAGGVFNSLSVLTLENTDSISYGRILSDSLLVFSDTSNIRYFAIAKAPIVPPGGVWYVPEVFSPNASNPNNQTFRFFGERVSSDGFLMRVYNRKRILVYETADLYQAKEVGWDGTNRNTGKDEPTGVYFYQITFKLMPLGIPEEEWKLDSKADQVYLIR